MSDEDVKDDIEKEEAVIIDKSQSSEDYEELFKNRYSEDDDYFQSSIKREVNPPPAIHPWYSKPRRNFDYARRRGGRHQSHESWGSSHGGRHHSSQHRDSHHSNGGGGGDRRNDRHRNYDRDRDDRRSENRHRPY